MAWPVLSWPDQNGTFVLKSTGGFEQVGGQKSPKCCGRHICMLPYVVVDVRPEDIPLQVSAVSLAVAALLGALLRGHILLAGGKTGA